MEYLAFVTLLTRNGCPPSERYYIVLPGTKSKYFMRLEWGGSKVLALNIRNLISYDQACRPYERVNNRRADIVRSSLVPLFDTLVVWLFPIVSLVKCKV